MLFFKHKSTGLQGISLNINFELLSYFAIELCCSFTA